MRLQYWPNDRDLQVDSSSILQLYQIVKNLIPPVFTFFHVVKIVQFIDPSNKFVSNKETNTWNKVPNVSQRPPSSSDPYRHPPTDTATSATRRHRPPRRQQTKHHQSVKPKHYIAHTMIQRKNTNLRRQQGLRQIRPLRPVQPPACRRGRCTSNNNNSTMTVILLLTTASILSFVIQSPSSSCIVSASSSSIVGSHVFLRGVAAPQAPNNVLRGQRLQNRRLQDDDDDDDYDDDVAPTNTASTEPATGATTATTLANTTTTTGAATANNDNNNNTDELLTSIENSESEISTLESTDDTALSPLEKEGEMEEEESVVVASPVGGEDGVVGTLGDGGGEDEYWDDEFEGEGYDDDIEGLEEEILEIEEEIECECRTAYVVCHY